ncbi:CPBP family intramembrane metalloprotease [bacterium]|nr:CPBP family intramembrane metalloprotease [bacterium]
MSNTKSKITLIALTILIVSVPSMIACGFIPFAYRFWLFSFIAVFLVLICFTQGIGIKKLGLRFDNLRQSLIWNTIALLLVLAFIFAIFAENIFQRQEKEFFNHFYLIYVLLIVPVQEFIFRGFVFAELDKAGIKGQAAQIIISAILFSYVHIIYRNPIFLVATFLLGIIWGITYNRHPNIIGTMASHAIIGIISFYLGIV